ncbi:MAG: RloB domain-containing protein [Magnetococcales bacterium]|nr:RloB domain-containing protein [Magnetococcales bacterium]
MIICCEGGNTEPLYLEAFAARHGVHLKRGTHIFGPCGVPETVFECALKKKKEKDHENRRNRTEFKVWIVIDVDEHAQRIPGLLKRAENKGIEVALSNPCVEVWALYHFDPPPTAELDRYMAQSKLQQRMPSYDKDQGKYFDLGMMNPGYEKAVRNARQARECAEREGTHLPNPSSSLDRLMELIRQMGSRPQPTPASNPA